MARRTSDSPLLFDLDLSGPDFALEKALRRDGCRHVAGTDEAGRGPLAGPVVAAAVILNPASIPAGLDDSKKLTGKQRNALFDVVLAQALSVSVASVSAESIDATDIRKASLEAMRRAVAGLSLRADAVLADGRDVPPGLPCPGQAVIRGDGRSVSIAAASIVAKVTRDRMMACLAPHHRAYGFDAHAGYATARHREAIAESGGVKRVHRFSFAPLRY